MADHLRGIHLAPLSRRVGAHLSDARQYLLFALWIAESFQAGGTSGLSALDSIGRTMTAFFPLPIHLSKDDEAEQIQSTQYADHNHSGLCAVEIRSSTRMEWNLTTSGLT